MIKIALNSVCILFSSILFSQANIPSEVKFIGYEKKAVSPNNTTLNFQVVNNTNSVIYLSSRNMDLKVTCDEKRLVNETNFDLVAIIPNTYITLAEIDSKSKEREKERVKFIEQISRKNSINKLSKADQDFMKKVISEDCIVVLPHESYPYSIVFKNKDFEMNCKVELSYIKTNLFSTFINTKGDETKIYF